MDIVHHAASPSSSPRAEPRSSNPSRRPSRPRRSLCAPCPRSARCSEPGWAAGVPHIPQGASASSPTSISKSRVHALIQAAAKSSRLKYRTQCTNLRERWRRPRGATAPMAEEVGRTAAGGRSTTWTTRRRAHELSADAGAPVRYRAMKARRRRNAGGRRRATRTEQRGGGAGGEPRAAEGVVPAPRRRRGGAREDGAPRRSSSRSRTTRRSSRSFERPRRRRRRRGASSTTRRRAAPCAKREMKVAAEKMEYPPAEAKKGRDCAPRQRGRRSARAAPATLESADERRRNELRLLRERARNVRMEMKRAADAQQCSGGGAASAELCTRRWRRAPPPSSSAASRSMRCRSTRSCERSRAAPSAPPAARTRTPPRRPAPLSTHTPPARPLSGADPPFRPFAITVELADSKVQLLDAPGYGDSLHAEVIRCDLRASRTIHAGGDGRRAGGARPPGLRHEDWLVHRLYFIAPHRLKAIDVEFLRPPLAPRQHRADHRQVGHGRRPKGRGGVQAQVRAISRRTDTAPASPHTPHPRLRCARRSSEGISSTRSTPPPSVRWSSRTASVQTSSRR